MELLISIFTVALFVSAAAIGGADTRDGEDWNHHRVI
jgi:hypothetical protein